ncbi:MAG: hypothetical protein H7Y37_16030, partial [Anaerolineae bacterium]|nr:hypothetical protein [Gloeobacterales cyanobacterium ES-bin-313]
MEPLRPATPNPTGTAAIEPPTLGNQPLYPQFLRPLGAEVLTVNDPSLFFPDGVPGYEPITNPYTTSPFFPAIPEAQATVATTPAPNPLPAPPQIPALLDTQFEALEEEIPETVLPSNIPILPSNVPNISAISGEPTETPQPQSVSDAGLQVLAQTNELPSERSATVPPTPSIAPQSILETEESGLLPRSPTPDVAQTPILAEQSVAPTLIASEQLLEQETALTEDLAEAESRPQPEVLAQNLIEAPEDLAEVSEANDQILQAENEERSSEITEQTPQSVPPQPNVLSAQPQVDMPGVQTPEETPAESENEQLSIVPNVGDGQFPEGITPALSRADIPEQAAEVTGSEAELSQETPTENQILPPAQISEPISEIGLGSIPEFVPDVEAVEPPGSDPEVETAESPGSSPEAVSSQNLGVLPQASEALLTESPGALPDPSSDNVVNLPESAPQIFTPERLQVDSVQDAGETRATSPPIPEPIPAETLLTSSEEFSEAIPAQTPEIPSRQDLEATPPETSDIASRQDPEAISTEDPEISSRQIFADRPAETLVG